MFTPISDDERRNYRAYRLEGRIQQVGSYLLVAVGLIVMLACSPCFPFNWVLGALLAAGARSMMMDARKLLMPDARLLLEIDKRPPVLYLRSFQDDGSYNRNPVLETAASAHPLSAVFRRLTHEEEIAETAQCVGPVIAVGKPGEGLPELGAARLYLNDDEWQPTVRDLMTSARLVILRTGQTLGLAWELATAKEVVSPERLVLYLEPPGALHDALRTLLPVSLPRSLAGARFVYFESDWKPRTARSLRAVLKYKRIYRVQLKTIMLIASTIVAGGLVSWFVYTLVNVAVKP